MAAAMFRIKTALPACEIEALSLEIIYFVACLLSVVLHLDSSDVVRCFEMPVVHSLG